MTARESILGSIRSRLASENRTGRPVKNWTLPVPLYAENPADNPLKWFIEKLESVHGSIVQIDDIQSLPSAVSEYLEKIGEQKKLVMAPTPCLMELDWSGMDTEAREANASDRVSVNLAFAGIAESGTIATLSSAESPVTLNFLPEVSIMVLAGSNLLVTLESLWPKIEQQPRALNLITGPSKTGDIEQTIVYGAHGPRQFHVVYIEGL